MYELLDRLQNYAENAHPFPSIREKDYKVQKARFDRCFQALDDTFTKEQRRLFLACEAEFNALWAIEESISFRRGFLVARELLR